MLLVYQLPFFWNIFTDIATDEENNKQYERDNDEKTLYHITMFLDGVIFLSICAWWFRSLLARWGLQLEISVFAWYVCAIYIFMMLLGNVMFGAAKPRKRAARFQLCLMIVLTIFCIALVDNYFDRKSPYAITTNEQQVVVYQSKEVSVLESATIEVDEETDEVTLTIDTSQQQIVDSTSLSYEYQTFDTVEIIATSDENSASTYSKKQMQETIEAAFNKISNLVGLETSVSADTSTDPADGAASYDTSN